MMQVICLLMTRTWNGTLACPGIVPPAFVMFPVAQNLVGARVRINGRRLTRITCRPWSISGKVHQPASLADRMPGSRRNTADLYLHSIGVLGLYTLFNCKRKA